MRSARTKNPISLASGVVPEFGPVETVEAAVAGGFDMVEIGRASCRERVLNLV